MSVVIAVRYKDGVALGADRQVTWGNLKKDTANKITQTRWSNIGLGGVGSGRLCDILEVIDDVVPAEDILKMVNINRKYLIRNIVPELFRQFKDYDMVLHDETGCRYIDGTLMIVTPEMIHAMTSNGSLIQYEDFAAIGCGGDLAYGYLSTLDKDFSKIKEDDVVKIITTAIQKACKDDAFVDDNIDILFIKRFDL